MNITSLFPFRQGAVPEPLYPSLPNPPGTSTPAPANVSPESSSSISPIASFLSQLDQIQQQSPAQYTNVASRIATQLQGDATAAQNSGNTAQAKTLTQLATEFQSSAQSGQVPSAQVLQKALAAHHGHHHGHPADATGTSSTSTSTSTSGGTSTASLLASALTNASSSTGTQV
jgi:hypothetical protein